MPAALLSLFSIPNALRGTLGRARAAVGALRPREERPVFHWNPWQPYWGEAYGPELKRWLLAPVFAELDADGKIGDVIVDFGSGAQPVTRLLKAGPRRKRILVDIAAENTRTDDEQKLRLDVAKLGDDSALSFRKALARARRFLGLTPGESDVPAVDTMVFSEILNYVDFRDVISRAGAYLKPNGRIIVVNFPLRGNLALFSERGLKNNYELYAFLEQEAFEIEQKRFPCRAAGEADEAEELIILVARKKAPVPFVLTFQAADASSDAA
jgi:hypothetical protein